MTFFKSSQKLRCERVFAFSLFKLCSQNYLYKWIRIAGSCYHATDFFSFFSFILVKYCCTCLLCIIKSALPVNFQQQQRQNSWKVVKWTTLWLDLLSTYVVHYLITDVWFLFFTTLVYKDCNLCAMLLTLSVLVSSNIYSEVCVWKCRKIYLILCIWNLLWSICLHQLIPLTLYWAVV